jgi:hypothetical protein
MATTAPCSHRPLRAYRGANASCDKGDRPRTQEGNFLKRWVRKNITPTTAHIRDDTLTAGRLAEECLWEAQGENLSAAEVIDAAGGNLFTFVVAELNRAAYQKIDDEGE